MKFVSAFLLGLTLFLAHPFCYGNQVGVENPNSLKSALQRDRFEKVKLEVAVSSIMFVGMLVNSSTFGGETHNEKFIAEVNFVEDEVFRLLKDSHLWQVFAKKFIYSRQERLEPERLFPLLMDEARKDEQFKSLAQISPLFRVLFENFEKNYNNTNLPLSAYLEQLNIVKFMKEDLIKAHVFLLERLKEYEDLAAVLAIENESFLGETEIENYVATHEQDVSMMKRIWNLFVSEEL